MLFCYGVSAVHLPPLIDLLAAFQRVSARWRRELGLSANEFLVLFQLWTNPDGALSMGRAGELVNVTSGGLTSIAARLERGGHVTRRPDFDDGRRTILCLTQHGRHMRDQMFAMLAGWNGPPELSELVGLLEQVADSTTRLDLAP